MPSHHIHIHKYSFDFHFFLLLFPCFPFSQYYFNPLLNCHQSVKCRNCIVFVEAKIIIATWYHILCFWCCSAWVKCWINWCLSRHATSASLIAYCIKILCICNRFHIWWLQSNWFICYQQHCNHYLIISIVSINIDSTASYWK